MASQASSTFDFDFYGNEDSWHLHDQLDSAESSQFDDEMKMEQVARFLQDLEPPWGEGSWTDPSNIVQNLPLVQQVSASLMLPSPNHSVNNSPFIRDDCCIIDASPTLQISDSLPDPSSGAASYPSPSENPPPETAGFFCSVEGCGKSYKTRNNLQRHRRDVHERAFSPTFVELAGAEGRIPLVMGVQKFDCPHAGCSRKGEKGFKRKDNMNQHQRLVHHTQLEKRTRRKPDEMPPKKRAKHNA